MPALFRRSRLWNGRDPILKERLFGLTGSEGNHGEDVKELYYYLDSTPTHSYMKALYKYPQAEFPYAQAAARRIAGRGLGATEFELIDTGVFDENRYFDVFAEYAKADENDIADSPNDRQSWPGKGDASSPADAVVSQHLVVGAGAGGMHRPNRRSRSKRDGLVRARHEVLGEYELAYEGAAAPLFTENETNATRLYGHVNGTAFAKDAFHEYVIHGRTEAVNPANVGTKFAPHYVLEIGAGRIAGR